MQLIIITIAKRDWTVLSLFHRVFSLEGVWVYSGAFLIIMIKSSTRLSHGQWASIIGDNSEKWSRISSRSMRSSTSDVKFGSRDRDNRKSVITESHLKNIRVIALEIYNKSAKDWCVCVWGLKWNTPLLSSESAAMSGSVCRSSLYFISTSWKQIMTTKKNSL